MCAVQLGRGCFGRTSRFAPRQGKSWNAPATGTSSSWSPSPMAARSWTSGTRGGAPTRTFKSELPVHSGLGVPDDAEPRVPSRQDATRRRQGAGEDGRKDHWATGIRFYEDVNMAWSKTAEGISRPVSPTECERMLGFPPKWTEPAEPHPRIRATQDAVHEEERCR